MSRSGEELAFGTLRAGLAARGDLRWAVAELGTMVEWLRLRRDLSPVAAAALGQLLAGTALMHHLQLKTPVRMIVELLGDGPLGRLTAEANNRGELRGAVTMPHAVVEGSAPGEIDVQAAVGEGLLRVIRQMENVTYDSKVPLIAGGIGHQLTHFLGQSDQTASAVLVGVLARPDGVASAGGMIVEALPGTDEDLLQGLEARLGALGSVSRLLARGGTDSLLDAVLGQLDREDHGERRLVYRCTCERDRFRAHLTGLSTPDREHLLEVQGDRASADLEIECSFCGERYVFQPEELRATQ